MCFFEGPRVCSRTDSLKYFALPCNTVSARADSAGLVEHASLPPCAKFANVRLEVYKQGHLSRHRLLIFFTYKNRGVALASSVSVVDVLHRGVPEAGIGLWHRMCFCQTAKESAIMETIMIKEICTAPMLPHRVEAQGTLQ